MRVLVVEDDEAIAAPLARGLEREGSWSTRAEHRRRRPRRRGRTTSCCSTSACPTSTASRCAAELRARSEVPIIVVTARGDEVDRVVGLELGADDYLVKPFGFRELVARIRAVARAGPGRGAVDDGATPSTARAI